MSEVETAKRVVLADYSRPREIKNYRHRVHRLALWLLLHEKRIVPIGNGDLWTAAKTHYGSGGSGTSRTESER